MRERTLRLGVGIAALALLTAACGTTDPTLSPDELELRSPGVLTVGSDIPWEPFEYEDDDGNLVGFDVELIEAIAEILGLEVEWVNAGFDTIFTQLAGGQFDAVASAVTAYAAEGTEVFDTVQDRRDIVSFTVPYYPSVQSLTVNTGRTPEIRSTEGLPDGARVGVERGTTGATWAEANLPAANLVTYDTAGDMYLHLDAGQLVGVVADLPLAQVGIRDRSELEIVEEMDTAEQFGFAVNRDKPMLLQAMNDVLEQMFRDGTYAAIFRAYFPDQELPAYASE